MTDLRASTKFFHFRSSGSSGHRSSILTSVLTCNVVMLQAGHGFFGVVGSGLKKTKLSWRGQLDVKIFVVVSGLVGIRRLLRWWHAPRFFRRG